LSQYPIENFKADYPCEKGQTTEQLIIDTTFREILEFNNTAYENALEKINVGMYDGKYAPDDVLD